MERIKPTPAGKSRSHRFGDGASVLLSWLNTRIPRRLNFFGIPRRVVAPAATPRGPASTAKPHVLNFGAVAESSFQ